MDKIQYPVAVAIWQFHLRGRVSSGVGRIYNWRLEGSSDNTAWTMLYNTTNTHISNPVYFTLATANTVNKYKYFRMFVVAAESPYPGLSAFQIYTVDDLM